MAGREGSGRRNLAQICLEEYSSVGYSNTAQTVEKVGVGAQTFPMTSLTQNSLYSSWVRLGDPDALDILEIDDVMGPRGMEMVWQFLDQPLAKTDWREVR